jgi:hypothetical protein
MKRDSTVLLVAALRRLPRFDGESTPTTTRNFDIE